MSKKQTQKNEQAPKKTEPAFEDFFTQFIEKRKKYFTTKLEEISVLEKTKDLKPDQIEKVNNKHLSIEKIRYYDDIKDLYFEAASKKGKAPQPAQPVQPTPVEVESGLNASDLVDLLAAGSLAKSAKSGLESFDGNSLISVVEIHSLLHNQELNKQLTETKHKLAEALKNKKLMDTVHQLLKLNVQAQPKKEVESKKKLFIEESDSEHEKEVSKKEPVRQLVVPPKKVYPPKDKGPQLGFQLVALPEKEEEVKEVFVTVEKRSGYNARKRFPRKEDGTTEHADKKEGEVEVKAEEGVDQKTGGYKGKNFDPNYKKGEGKKINKDAPKVVNEEIKKSE